MAGLHRCDHHNDAAHLSIQTEQRRPSVLGKPFLLTTLKDIFRPTRNKIVLSGVLGPALTMLGLFMGSLARHGPEIVQYIALPLAFPYIPVVRLNLAGTLWWVGLLISAFVYWYPIFCLCAFLRSRLRGRR